MWDVAIVGSGPAGSTCAALCAQAGLRTVLLEREKFPREKVCGDCLNPSCWPVLRRLGAEGRVRALVHGKLDTVEFIAIGGQTIRVALPSGDAAEIAIKRSLFDQVLMDRARELGAHIREGAPVTTIAAHNTAGWRISARDEPFEARTVVAADGRNSTIARLCNLLPRIAKERIALQTHLPLPRDFGEKVVLQFLPHGYSGQAPVGGGDLNLCLVSTASHLAAMRSWAEKNFKIPSTQPWRTITPLARAPINPARGSLFLVGDAARVVEPFTGEGIYYALRSGELAANAIAGIVHGGDAAELARRYALLHGAMYRGRLWVNRLARAAVLSPRIASLALELARFQPSLLRAFTAKIVKS